MYESIEKILSLLLQLIFFLFNPIVLIPAGIITFVIIKRIKEYKNSAYYYVTKTPYWSLRDDLGKYGEYLTYIYLKHYENIGAKFLFNIYLPKENGETTEIDVLMICSKGVFVIESKNYSGWIFGSETQKNWYQTLPQGRGRSQKESFYNPIMQNFSHIKHLKNFIGEHIPIRSLVVFSDTCTLKRVQLKSSDVIVVNRKRASSVIAEICGRIPKELLNECQIDNIYNKLYPYTQVDDFVKVHHILNLQSNKNTQTAMNSPQSFFSFATQPINTFPAGSQNVENVIHNQEQTTSPKLYDCHSTNIEVVLPHQNIEEKYDLRCPRCNGRLVVRTAKRGVNIGKKFYGCSNYPKCKYIQNIE